MVFACVQDGCHVDTSASCPLDSTSAATSAYGASLPVCICLLTGCRITSCCATSTLHHHPLHSHLSPPSSTAPLCLHRLVVTSNLVAPPPLLDAPPAHILPFAAPLPHIRQLALSCTAIFIAPSPDTATIAGVLKCTAHLPGGGITNVHCPLLHGSHPPTRLPAPLHRPRCFCRQGEGITK